MHLSRYGKYFSNPGHCGYETVLLSADFLYRLHPQRTITVSAIGIRHLSVIGITAADRALEENIIVLKVKVE